MDRDGRSHGRPVLLIVFLVFGLVVLSACKSSSGSGTATEKLYSPQNEELDVYDITTGKMTVLIPGSVDGMPANAGNVNGQVCRLPDKSGRLLMAGDHQQDQGDRSGWSIFTQDGTFERKIPEPVSPGEAANVDQIGCVFDAQGRLFVTDVGDENFTGGNGKLIMYFPPDYRSFCFLDTSIRVAGTVAVDGLGNVLVAQTEPPGDVLRFAAPFPQDANHCPPPPAANSVFIQDANLGTPAGIAKAPNGDWYVSSVFIAPGIYEYDNSGKFVRTIASGADIGNPQGISVDSKGTIYYADLALVSKNGGLPGPADGKGTVRKITFDKSGSPQPPVIIGSGLSFPDAVTVLPAPKF